MSDLLSGARDLRQKLYRLEVLLQIKGGRRTRDWFAGKSPVDSERVAVIRRLVRTGLIEPVPAPTYFRLTADGHDFLKDVRTKVGSQGALDWTRADEIDFSKL